MKYKLLAMLLTALMLASPAVGFWHPPPGPQPPCTYFGTLINGNYTWAFKEPADGFCDDFHVTVYIANVTDLYGYDFVLAWDASYFNLVSWTVATNIWTAQAIIFNGTIAANQYEQIVTALPPSTGATGDFQLADLVFHINNDVCPNSQGASGWFPLYVAKASDSCSGKITLCNGVWATWTFTPVKPELTIIPAIEVNSVVGSQFTASVLIKNIVKMTDFDIEIAWNQYLHDPAINCWPLAGMWSTLLTTDEKSVILNGALFNTTTATITVNSPECGWYNSTDQVGTVRVIADVVDALASINATNPSQTFWLFNVTFTKCDAWFCGAQPHYYPKPNHDWSLENASTPIYFTYISVSSDCGLLDYTVFTYTNALFTFVPVPGDLDGSGHVDIADLMIESGYYGATVSCNSGDIPAGNPSNGFTYYYDLNHDGVIDIYDIVIVAKNFCRTTPSDP